MCSRCNAVEHVHPTPKLTSVLGQIQALQPTGRLHVWQGARDLSGMLLPAVHRAELVAPGNAFEGGKHTLRTEQRHISVTSPDGRTCGSDTFFLGNTGTLVVSRV